MPTVMQWVVAVVGAFGGGKFMYDIVMARSQGKKIKTDNAVTLVNSAAAYAEGLVKRIDSVGNRFDEFRREQEIKNAEQDRRNRAQDRLLLQHSQWDHLVVTQLKAKGISVTEPPPLFLTEGTD